MSKIIPDHVPNWVTRPIYFMGMEVPRMAIEMVATPLSLPWLIRHRTSQGQPLLVVPAMSPAMSMLEMRLALTVLGHKVHCMPELEMVSKKPRTIREDVIAETVRLSEHYQQPINLVAWCYGGAFARMAAMAVPDRVRQVITMGAALEGRSYPKEYASSGTSPLPVPATAIYSRTDGMFDHHQVRQPEGWDRAENIEIPSSHFGMANHPMAIHVIADRLAQPKDGWRPFGGWNLDNAGDSPEPVAKRVRVA